MNKNDFALSKWLPICVIAVILMIAYKTIDNISQITSAIGHFLLVISPLLYGILFAYFLFTPHKAVEKLLRKTKWKFISKHARGFTTIVIFVLLAVIVGFILSFLLPIVFSSIIDFANSLPGFVSTVLAYFDNMPSDSIWVSLDVAVLIRNYSGALINAVINPTGLEQVAKGVISFTGEIFSIIMGLVISLYILLDREKITNFCKRLNIALFRRDDRIERNKKYIKQINQVLFTFIASKGLDSLINFIVATTVLLIFGVPYALLLGLIAGVFNFIPYLGSIISAVIISTITLITSGLSTAGLVLLCLLLFHQLDGNFIEPRIMKSSLKINPILVIIAVVIGGAYIGIVGMFLAVPIAVVIKQILLEYMASRESENNDGEQPEIIDEEIETP